MSGLISVGYFLVTLLFDLLIFALLCRIALRYYRISALNSFSQLIHTLSSPLIKPLHWLTQIKDSTRQKYDWCAILALVLVEGMKILSLSLLVLGLILPLPYFLLYVLADLIIQPCRLLLYAIIIRVVMSYVNPYWQNPVADFLKLITNPLLLIGRKIIPDISGFDFSPFVMMIILEVMILFVSGSLPVKLL